MRATAFTAWKRGGARGARNLWRERGLVSSLVALLGVLIIMQLMFFLLIGMQGFQSLLQAHTSIRLELKPTASDQEIQQFLSSIEELPYVASQKYITKESAYAQMKERDPELILFLEEFNLENPFPETVIVTLFSLSEFDKLVKELGSATWQNIIDPRFLSDATNQETEVYELLRITSAGRSIGVFFLLLTTIVLIVITVELVRERVHRRSQEIMVEHLTGALTSGILLPFVVELTILLILAIIVSAALLVGITMMLPVIAPTLTQGSLQQLSTIVTRLLIQKGPLLLGMQILAAPVVAFIGATIATLPKIHGRALTLRV